MVNPTDFDGILTREIICRVSSAGVLWFVAVVGLVFDVVHIKRAKCVERKNCGIIILAIILIIGLPIFAYSRVLPIVNDISHQTVVRATGFYQVGAIEKEFKTAYISAQIGNEKINLEIPMGKQKCFPREDCLGTFWYAKDSLILLMFVSEDGIIYTAE